MVWPRGAGHRYGVAGHPWMHSWLHCDGEAVERLLDAEGIPRDRPILGFQPQPFEHILRLMHRECTAHAVADPGVVLDLLHILAREIGRHVRHGDGAVLPAPLAELRHRLDSHPAQRWTIAGMARVCGWSPSHFAHEFRRHFGCPPLEYLIRLRLHRARHLLADRNRSVATVAAEVGYHDLPHFSRLFRARFGSSPRTLRRVSG